MNIGMNSNDVWNSPEFQALAKLIGIPLTPPTTGLTIRLRFGAQLGPCEITQDYYAIGPLRDDTDPAVVIKSEYDR